MDNFIAYLDPRNWFSYTIVELKQFNAAKQLEQTINISNYGTLTIDGKNRGYVKPPYIYKLIAQYGIYHMEGRYDDSLNPQPYTELTLWTPRYGQWFIHAEPSMPYDLGLFIRDIKSIAVQYDKNDTSEIV